MDYSSEMRLVLGAIEGVERRSQLMFSIFVFFVIATAVFLIFRINSAVTQIEEITNVSPFSNARQSVRDELENNIDPSTDANSATAGWKTYRNEAFGFEVKYPADLIIEFVNSSSKGGLKDITIYDPNYTAPEGAVGQQVRHEFRQFRATIYPFSEVFADNFPETKYGPVNNDITVDIPGGTVRTYIATSGLIGPYFEGRIFNDKYYFSLYSGNLDINLWRQVLSTFKFIE